MTECEARNPRKFCTWARIVWLQPWFKGWWAPVVEGLKQTGWKIENPNWRRFYHSGPWDVHCTETLSNEPSISLLVKAHWSVLQTPVLWNSKGQKYTNARGTGTEGREKRNLRVANLNSTWTSGTRPLAEDNLYCLPHFLLSYLTQSNKGEEMKWLNYLA